jgi:hypothetical protein
MSKGRGIKAKNSPFNIPQRWYLWVSKDEGEGKPEMAHLRPELNNAMLNRKEAGFYVEYKQEGKISNYNSYFL